MRYAFPFFIYICRMIDYIDYTIAEFINLPDEVQREIFIFSRLCKKFDEPIDIFNIESLEEKKFGLIKDLQTDLNKGIGLFDIVEYIKKLTTFDINKVTVLQLFQQKNWIVTKIDLITQNENETLSSSPSVAEIRAGFDDFEDLGNFMQLYSLCKNGIVDYETVYNMPYNIAYAFLLADKKMADSQRKLYANG